MDMTEKIVGSVGVVVITIVLLAMTPTIVEQTQAMLAIAVAPATAWNFTGAEGAIQLLGLVPFVWVAGILISSAIGMFAMARGAPAKKI